MRSAKGLTAAVAATAALVVAVQGAAAGPITVSNVYAVGGQSVPGSTTGLVLTSGMKVTVSATGAVCPFGDSFCPGPNGYAPWDTTQSSYGGFPLPGAPAWGLVGRVGSGPWVQVGSGPTTLSGTGELVFAVNDDLLVDNVGSFMVTVSYTCWPGWGYGDKNHTHCGPPGLVSKTKPAPGSSAGGRGNGNASRSNASGGAANGKGAPESGTGQKGNDDQTGNGNGNGSGNGNAKGGDQGKH